LQVATLPEAIETAHLKHWNYGPLVLYSARDITWHILTKLM
jgi:hypothetical protein